MFFKQFIFLKLAYLLIQRISFSVLSLYLLFNIPFCFGVQTGSPENVVTWGEEYHGTLFNTSEIHFKAQLQQFAENSLIVVDVNYTSPISQESNFYELLVRHEKRPTLENYDSRDPSGSHIELALNSCDDGNANPNGTYYFALVPSSSSGVDFPENGIDYVFQAVLDYPYCDDDLEIGVGFGILMGILIGITIASLFVLMAIGVRFCRSRSKSVRDSKREESSKESSAWKERVNS
eukprot:gb/GECH01000260.1/.p1 GENE.gb/GECH01000260.1/~~gb/GECH01000260.1/.p1  ORF type:complete len:235 (+),score=38.62 gb/GECH01000260.1/:1-705(+)